MFSDRKFLWWRVKKMLPFWWALGIHILYRKTVEQTLISCFWNNGFMAFCSEIWKKCIVGDQSYINGERNNGLSFFVWGYMEPAEEIVSSWWECSLLMDITTNRTWSGQQERWSESESRSPGCTMCELRAAGWCYISPTSTYTWNITYTGGSQGSDDL